MLVISQNITSTMMSSVRTSPYIAPANPRSTAANRPTPCVLPSKYQRQYSRTSAPTPVTMSVRTQLRVSMRIERSMPSWGIQGRDSAGTRPAMTSGVAMAAWTKATTGSSAATKNAREPIRPTSHGSASGITANAARNTSNLAS